MNIFRTLFLLVVSTALLGSAAMGQILTEQFNYTDHATNGLATQSAGAWFNVNTGDSVLVTTGSLSYTGLQASIGNKIAFAGTGIDPQRTFASQTSGTIYYSFLLNVASLSGITSLTGSYFTGYRGGGATTFGQTVWIKNNDGSSYYLGISPRSSGGTPVQTYTAGTYPVSTPVLVVASYEFVAGALNDVVKLWVNPSSGSFGGSEPTPDLTITNNSGSGDLSSVDGVFLRQENAAGTPALDLDEVRVGTSWAVVTPPLPSNQYRSFASGDWNAIGTWEVSTNGGGSWNPAAATPTSADDAVTILATHTVTVTASVSVDQVTVATGGTLHVNSGNTLTVDNGTGTDVTVNGTLSTAGTVSVAASGVVAVNGGSFQINEGGWGGNTGSYTYDATGTLVFNGTTSYGVNADAVWWPNPITNVTVQNTGGVSINTARTVSTLIQTSAGITNGGNLTVDGTFRLNASGYITGAPTYGGSSTLTYSTGGTYVRGAEWSATGGAGFPNNVQISNSTTLDMGPNGGFQFQRHAANDLTIDVGSEFTMNGVGNAMSNKVVIFGDIMNSGTITLSSLSGGDLHVRGNYSQSSTFNSNGRLLVFDATGPQSLSATGGMTLDNLFVVFDSELSLLNDVTINGVLTVFGKIHTGSQKVILGPTGSMSETGGGKIVYGTVEAARTISANAVNETFGGIGMELNAVTGPVPGATTITRVTGTAQTGAGNQSIKRYYDINAATSTGLNVTMVFRYDNTVAEMNTNVEGTLSPYRSTDLGATWLTTGASTANGINYATMSGVTSFSRWTLADATHPLVTAASTTSDVVAVASSEATTISSIVNDASPLSSSTGTQVWQVTFRDGGGAIDADAFPTELVAMSLTQSGVNQVPTWSNAILAADLFDGATQLASGTVGASSIIFTAFSASAADGGNKTLSVRISLKDPLGSGVLDNQHFGFEVLNANVTAGNSLTSSQFSAFPAISSDIMQNKINVIATHLAFTDQPAASAPTGANLAPVAVAAQDTNGNTDADFANAVTLSSGTFTLASTDVGGLTQTPVAGVASWANLSSSVAGTGTVLANATGVSQGTSNSINVLGPTVTSAASGNWNVGGTWVGGAVPLPSQSAIIATGHTVTLTVNDTCAAATVQSGGVLDIATFRLNLAGTYTIQSGAEGRQALFNPVPGGGGTPWAFATTSTYTFHGAATGFSIGAAPGITFGHVNWNSTANGTPPIGTVIAGNLILGGTGEMRCGTGTSVRTITVLNNVIINSGTLVASNAGGAGSGTLFVGGSLTINASGTLRGVNSSGTGTVIVTQDFINNGGACTMGAGAGAYTLRLIPTAGSPRVFNPGATNTFGNVYVTGMRDLSANSVNIATGFTFIDSGYFDCNGQTISGAGNFVLAPGGRLVSRSADGLTASGATGDVQVTGTRTFSTQGRYTYSGSVAQQTGSGLPANVKQIQITNSAGVALTSSVTIDSSLSLQFGTLHTGANSVTIAPTASLTRLAGHVNGNLTKTVTVALTSVTVATGPGAVFFEIGDSTKYTPVLVEGSLYVSSFSLTASTTAGDHPDIATSGLDGAQSVNRYYTITGSPTGSSDITFNFVSADVDGGASTGSFIVGKYDSPTWTLPTVSTLTSTSTKILGVTSFSDFAIGEAFVAPVPAFSALDSLAFGDVVKNESSDSLVCITNTGNAPLTIDSLIVGGGEFATAFSGPVTLLAGEDTCFTVSFSPSVSGPQTGTITFYHNAGSSSDVMYLSGNGIQSAFAVDQSSVSFGSVQVTTSDADTVTVSNLGGSALVIDSVVVYGDASFSVSPNGTATIGAPVDYVITFSPTLVTAQNASIVWYSNSKSSPDTVTVSGTGTPVGPSPKFLSISPDTIIAKDPIKLKFLKSVKRAKPGKPIVMPNWANLLDETVAQGGFGPGASTGDSAGGALIGVSYMFKKNPADPLKPKWSPVKDSANIYAWIRLTKWDFKKNLGKGYNALQKTLESKTFNHMVNAATHRPRGLDSTLSPGMEKRKQMKKQATKLDSKKTPNNLFAELVALKVNIAASQMEKTPAGFGELIFDVDTSAFDEMEVKAISEKADSMMTYWQGYTPIDSLGANYDQYDDLYSAVYAINRAFIGVLDTASFMQTDTTFILGKLRLLGQVEIDDVPYMKLPVAFRPVTMAATTYEVESSEEEDFLDEEWENAEGVPVAAKLYQNYPNPFNPSTTISFQLLETSQVTVKIFNLLGQEVATLFNNEEFEEGYNLVQFDAAGLSSGVYFYQIQAQGVDDAGLRTIATQKMVLLK
ncbi:MAG: choice-of-anchor D domain-containing protein [Bacteroidota bacterium]